MYNIQLSLSNFNSLTNYFGILHTLLVINYYNIFL